MSSILEERAELAGLKACLVQNTRKHDVES